MNISTTRFGTVQIETEDIIHFPAGLVGFEKCCHWALLADHKSDRYAWLQSISQGAVAMAVVSPRSFMPDYRLRVAADEMAHLELRDHHCLHMLVIAAISEDQITFNLKSPLVINLDRRLGRQVISLDDQPLQLALPKATLQMPDVA